MIYWHNGYKKCIEQKVNPRQRAICEFRPPRREQSPAVWMKSKLGLICMINHGAALSLISALGQVVFNWATWTGHQDRCAVREYLLDLHLIIITSWSFFYLLELVMNGVGREKRPRGCCNRFALLGWGAAEMRGALPPKTSSFLSLITRNLTHDQSRKAHPTRPY